MTDMASLIRVLSMCKPDEVYNLAAQSHVQISFNQPIYTTNTIVMGIINLLEAVKLICPEARIYQASSSEMFGNSIDEDGYQRETTPMHPVSPYGCAKLFAHKLCQTYRASYNMYISCGILFIISSIICSNVYFGFQFVSFNNLVLSPFSQFNSSGLIYLTSVSTYFSQSKPSFSNTY